MYGMDMEEVRYYVQESRRSLAQTMKDSYVDQKSMLLTCSQLLTWVGLQLVACGQRLKALATAANDRKRTCVQGMENRAP